MRCGFYETEITPPTGATMFGYFGKRVNKDVITKLYAKAAVFESNGRHLALLCVDCLGVPMGLAEFVREKVNEVTGIEKGAIMVASTHSHTSGPTNDNLGNFKDRVPLLENEPVLDSELDSFYLRMAQLLASDTVIRAYNKLQDAVVTFGTGRAEDINFIREYVLENGEIRTNPGDTISNPVKPVAEADRSLPVFFVKDKEGNPLGSVTSFALHHDTVSSIDKISADYSGLVGDNLKEKYGKNFVSVFFSGFCGNINHIDFIKPKRVLKTAHIADVLTAEIVRVANEVAQPLKGEMLSSGWETVSIKKREVPKEHTERVLRLRENPPQGTMSIADPYSDILVYAGSNGYISYYVDDKRDAIDVPVHVVRIGECVVYSFCGEIFSQFGDMIREASPTDKVMLVSKANTKNVDSYVPTRDMFLPNVYESTYTSATLCPDAGYQLVDLAVKMANELFSK